MSDESNNLEFRLEKIDKRRARVAVMIGTELQHVANLDPGAAKSIDAFFVALEDKGLRIDRVEAEPRLLQLLIDTITPRENASASKAEKSC